MCVCACVQELLKMFNFKNKINLRFIRLLSQKLTFCLKIGIDNKIHLNYKRLCNENSLNVARVSWKKFSAASLVEDFLIMK